MTNLIFCKHVEKARQLKDERFSLMIYCHDLTSFFSNHMQISNNLKIRQYYHCGAGWMRCLLMRLLPTSSPHGLRSTSVCCFVRWNYYTKTGLRSRRRPSASLGPFVRPSFATKEIHFALSFDPQSYVFFGDFSCSTVISVCDGNSRWQVKVDVKSKKTRQNAVPQDEIGHFLGGDCIVPA